MVEKRNIFLVGPAGAGKSTIGRQLADILHLDFYDSDNEIEDKTGADVSWIVDLEGEDGFRKREEEMINSLTDFQGIVLATGSDSIVSNTIRNRLSARGIVVYLHTSIEKQIYRTQREKNSSKFLSEKANQKLRELSEVRAPLYNSIADYTIETDEQSARSIANEIINKINL